MPHLLPSEEFQRTLPTKRMTAAVVFRDAAGGFLIVCPTYKDCWELPGGVVDADESPWTAAAREVCEELGLVFEPGRLLAVDYCGPEPGRYVEAVHFLFDGGVIDPDTIESIALPEDELATFRFTDLDEAQRLLCRRVGTRLAAVATAPRTPIYLEDGVERA
jgi:8-oxo-dGTP diphosphatase